MVGGICQTDLKRNDKEVILIFWQKYSQKELELPFVKKKFFFWQKRFDIALNVWKLDNFTGIHEFNGLGNQMIIGKHLTKIILWKFLTKNAPKRRHFAKVEMADIQILYQLLGI